MPDDQKITDELLGRQFAMEAILVRLILLYVKTQRFPRATLAELMEPIERSLAEMSALQGEESAALRSARETVRHLTEEMEDLLHKDLTDFSDEINRIQ